MKTINKAGVSGHNRTLECAVALAMALCALMCGCGNQKTIWSVDVPSPDGRVVASARALVRNQGLSIISGTDTDVYLKWASGSRGETSVLELADASDQPIDTRVEVQWISPTHVELTFKGNQTVVFQAVKWVGIDISVRDLGKNRTESEIPPRAAHLTESQHAISLTNRLHREFGRVAYWCPRASL